MAVEARRKCGYRKVGGLYLVSGGIGMPCDRMPYPLDRCPTCGNGVKFTRGHTWLLPEFFSHHAECLDDGAVCPVCRVGKQFGPHLLVWIGRAHYSPSDFLEEARDMGISRRVLAIPKGLIVGETWVLNAHLDAVPPKHPIRCALCGSLKDDARHFPGSNCADHAYEPMKPTPGIFSAFIPQRIELLLKQSDATPERLEKEAKRGVTVIAVPDDDKDHQGTVWDKPEENGDELS